MANPPGVPMINLGTNKTLRDWVAFTRDYMRDYPLLNRLIAGEETNDRMFAFALMFTVDKFNITPPLIPFVGIEGVPPVLLLKGASSHILYSAGLLYARNQLDYSAGGVSVAHSNKTPLYQSWIQMQESEWHQMVKAFKISKNIEEAYGHGVASEYLFLVLALSFGRGPGFGRDTKWLFRRFLVRRNGREQSRARKNRYPDYEISTS